MPALRPIQPKQLPAQHRVFSPRPPPPTSSPPLFHPVPHLHRIPRPKLTPCHVLFQIIPPSFYSLNSDTSRHLIKSKPCRYPVRAAYISLRFFKHNYPRLVPPSHAHEFDFCRLFSASSLIQLLALDFPNPVSRLERPRIQQPVPPNPPSTSLCMITTLGHDGFGPSKLTKSTS